MTQLSDNISATFIVDILMECQMITTPFYVGHIDLKVNQLNNVDQEKHFPLHNTI
jgi:hypothetical protein